MNRLIRAGAAALLIAALTATVATATGKQDGDRDTIILIKKTDTSGAPLAGAVFHITGPGLGDPLVVTSDDNGIACAEGLNAPNDGLLWTVTEVAAPAGYVVDPTPQTTNGDDDRNADCDRDGESADLWFTNEKAEEPPEPTPTPTPSSPDPTPTPTPTPSNPTGNVSPPPGLPDTAVAP